MPSRSRVSYLGSEPVPVDKTNEILVVRKMFERLDLVGRLVGLDALHTQMETAECSDVWLSASLPNGIPAMKSASAPP